MKSSLFHLIIWVSLCAATILGQGFWYSAISKKSAEVADLQNQIDTRTETTRRIALAHTALVEIASDESSVENYFVPETGIVSFINDLESRARGQTAAMKVLSVSVGASVKQPTLIFTIAIDGTFDAVMRTVGVIEYAPYSISISKFSLAKAEKKTWSANLELIVGSVSAASTATSTKETAQKVISFFYP